MSTLEIFIFTVLGYILWYLYRGFRKPKNFPPGPPKVPFFGTNLSTSGLHSAIYSSKDCEKYGNVIGYFRYGMPFVMINDAKIAKEVFNQDVFSGRMNGKTLRHLKSFDKELGIISTSNEIWSSQRKFALKTLKDFGFGRKGSEGIIQEEASMITEYFRKRNGEDLFMSVLFNVPIVNVLWQMVASKRFEMDDQAVEDLMNTLTNMMTTRNPLLFMIPSISKYLLPEFSGYNERRAMFQEMHKQFRDSIEEHKTTRDPSEPRDFVDAYLNEIDEVKNPLFTEEQLIVDILDLFLAGAETTSTTLKWAVIYMIKNQEVQNKCREEIWSVIGRTRQPNLNDIVDLPYCHATILEIQRMGSIAPTSLIHRCKSEAVIEGHVIPANTLMEVNIMHIMYNPKIFPKPNEFKPEHFLEADGKVTKNLDNFIPFGIGRRVCMGETLAKNELYLFFMTLLQNVKFDFPKGSGTTMPDESKYRMNVTRVPHDFHVHVTAV